MSDFIAQRSSASFLQTPGWARVKAEWDALNLGWFDDTDSLVGVGLALLRHLPVGKRCLAYLPEGPLVDWSGDIEALMDPLVALLKDHGAFAVRIGPPVVLRRWDVKAVKEGIADDTVASLHDVAPSTREVAGARVVSELSSTGWHLQSADSGFSAGQPAFNFQLPLIDADAQPLDEAAVLRGMNQQWRRNIKKSEKLGVETRRVPDDEVPGELKSFHDLYVHTAERDGFTPRGFNYFVTMFAALNADEPGRISLYQATHQGDLVAATIAVIVGDHVWYSYGASATHKREVRGSNAVQWLMIRDALAAGATTYDLRGITPTLRRDDAHVGLIQFKSGLGGEAVEYAGEWDKPINRALYKAFSLYVARR